ncbi:MULTISPECIES: hypothetical protein [Kitasatospora]|uniref:Uncharacterized protein n=1 Tax=Kitasatospora cathayae TaxID=3004092 RepID=A0ABY7PVS2_9ACTN|nr:hypothetical protein [Kitasatospora sp. HUAS 3-15]WBP84461.1 hypothetical protein O1G21_00390 [Kitasatospora sp. HUAS 3-15]
MSDQDPTREHDTPVPKDPPAPVETPESRMADDGPPPVPEEGQRRPDGRRESELTEPAHEPEPHETPD